MKFCPECGAKFAEGAKFCSGCGEPRTVTNLTATPYGPKEVFIYVAYALYALEGSEFEFEIDENSSLICCTFNHLIEFDKSNRIEIRSLLSQVEEEGYFVCNTYWEDAEDDLEGLEIWSPTEEVRVPVEFQSSEARTEALESVLNWSSQSAELEPWLSEFLVGGLQRVTALTQCQHGDETRNGQKCKKCHQFARDWPLAKSLGLFA